MKPLQHAIYKLLTIFSFSIHYVSKNVPLCNCPYLWHILANFRNSFTRTLFGQFAIKHYWISHHTITALLHYLVKYKCKKKTSNTKQQACWKMKDTSDQNRDKWSVQCYAVLDPSLCGVLYRVFVSGLHGLVRLPVHPQWSRSLQYVHASICRSHAFVQCFLLSKSF